VKFVIWITGLFALAVLVGLASTLNTGYAILFLPPWRMEVSFNLLLLGIVVLIVLAYAVMRVISITAGLPAEVKRFQRQKKLKAARHALREAGIAFLKAASRKPNAKHSRPWKTSTRQKTVRWPCCWPPALPVLPAIWTSATSTCNSWTPCQSACNWRATCWMPS
jgi:uncharacterized protein HemY